ncbi:50S ribosomal protein L32 [bacterium]|nr:50S ribosomal protein L32 [bacterium]
MGGVPKRHKTKSKVGMRRSHLKLEKKNLVACSHCGNLILPHRVCPYCGYYRGKMVIDVFAKLTKKERKLKEKELKESSKSSRQEQS